MIVSAVTIDGLDKAEQKEHFFNDVKYATISLDKDIRQITEIYDEKILQLDLSKVKGRLQGEYNELCKSTYGFLKLDQFSFGAKQVKEYVTALDQLGIEWMTALKRIADITGEFSKLGFVNHWNYQMLYGFLALFEAIGEDVVPTRYWLNASKYDFIQELMNEAQTKIEEYTTAMKHIRQTWSEQILEDENVAMLDYYIERRSAGLKLFDVTFHKSKKVLKELFVDEYRTFCDAEIEQLHTNVYIVKRNDYWITRNHSRIQQFLGMTYQGVDTDFVKLRSQYAIFYKIGTDYGNQQDLQMLTKTFLEQECYDGLLKLVCELKDNLQVLPMDQLLSRFPCDKEQVVQGELPYVAKVLFDFYETLLHLNEDYEVFTSYCHYNKDREQFKIDDIRKVFYCLERINQKQDWMKQNQYKIKELLRNEKPTTETDWNALKDKLFNTELEKCFPKYEIVDKRSILESNYGQDSLIDVVRFVLQKECPVKEEILYKRVVQLMDLPRLIPKVKAEIQWLLENDLAEEFYKKDEFLFMNTDVPLILRTPADGEDKRDISMIAREELKSGILMLIEHSYEITMDGIGKGIAGILGYPRRSKKFNDTIETVVLELQREGKIRRFSGGFQILVD